MAGRSMKTRFYVIRYRDKTKYTIEAIRMEINNGTVHFIDMHPMNDATQITVLAFGPGAWDSCGVYEAGALLSVESIEL